MKKLYTFLLAGLLFGGSAIAQPYNVTFQVDMTGQTVDPNGPHIAGNFQAAAGFPGDWDPAATSLTLVSGTIYEVSVSLPAGNYEFKYINGNAWGSDEAPPAVAGIQPSNGNYNRFVSVVSDTTLPAVVYGAGAPVGMVAWRQMVDMNMQTPSANGIHVAGNFQAAAGAPGDWDPATTELFDVLGDGVYQGIFYVPAGTYQYKYINGDAWSDNESVPSACEVGGNREIVLAGDTVGGPLCFGMCTACPAAPLPQYSMTIQVDLSASCLLDIAGGDSVDVAGTFNGWGGTRIWALDPDGDGIYETTVMADSGEVKYKARIIKATSDNWEGGGDKVVDLSSDTTLEVRCFGADVNGACAPKPANGPVTFRVDMSNEVLQSGGVWIMGDFTVPNWQDGALQLSPTPSNPAVFELVLNDFCPGSAQYKFVNGTPNATGTVEEDYDFAQDGCGVVNGSFPDNRVATRTDDQMHIYQHVFNSCTELSISVDEFSKEPLTIMPNPMSEGAVIALPAEGQFDVVMVDVTGRIVRNMNGVNGNVSIERGNLVSGIYFLNVVNEAGSVNTSKLIVQ
jgi:hypothetical protein